VRIADDTGGQIGAYLAKYRALKASGERVEIDGTCASACTMLLGARGPPQVPVAQTAQALRRD
jgi:hypothetical protein